jgi:PAS domain S-box-containing protein/putative nucleotidyltransferase with HDIG domain
VKQRTFRILCIDDEPMILDLYRTILQGGEQSRDSLFQGIKSLPRVNQKRELNENDYVFEVSCCHQGEDGIDAVREALTAGKPFAAAFIDVRMPPGINGIDTAARIRELDADIELVIVTGYSDISINNINTRIKPVHKLLFMKKPFQLQEIKQCAFSLSEKWASLIQNRQLMQLLEEKVDVKDKELSDTYSQLVQEKEALVEKEKDLEETKYSLNELYENANEMIHSLDLEGNILFVNPLWEQLMGYSKEDIVGKSMFDVMSADRIEHCRTLYAKVLTGIPIYGVTTEFIKKNGEKLFVEGNIIPKMQLDKVMGVNSFCRDVTLRRQAELDLSITAENLRKLFPSVIQALATTVEIRDPYTAGHQTRVANLARAIAEAMKLPHESIEGVYIAGMLHDIGKISVPSEILSKPGKLWSSEFDLIKNHVRVGYNLLKKISFPWRIADFVLQHHERNDGSGYPQGLLKEDLLIESQILIVSDVVEAISSHRPYRPSLGIEYALQELSDGREVRFNVDVVNVCIDLFTRQGYEFENKTL